ncbi:8-amino-7-oxononanoate synthase, partial [Candidatus Sumerlaeota bacterium]|nr:8-amino-7-oxononanoate synthase [Candidatus Sumerlaeota bacterium]
ITVSGREYLHLCSNNYLGLATHPAVIEGACKATRDWGAGAGASRLITGTTRAAEALERSLAEFKRAERALLFASGYLANIGLICALARNGDWLICDQLNHASLIDAARLSGAAIHVYPHNDAKGAADILARAPREARKFIVTDGVFSMDGDLAPLAELDALAREHGAWLVVDDAHGTGTAGEGGRGSCSHFGIGGEHLIQVITLSKALGSQGGAVVGSAGLVDLLINRARTFIFETGLAPAAIGAAQAALQVLGREPERIEKLRVNAAFIRRGFAQQGFPIIEDAIPIIPLLVGDNDVAIRASGALKARGFWVTAIRPPSVELGKARLRLTVMAEHDTSELARVVSALAEQSGGLGKADLFRHGTV